MLQYRKLRNLVNSRIRKDTIDFNNKRITQAETAKEMWNVVNSVNNPKRNDDWCIQTENGETNDKQII